MDHSMPMTEAISITTLTTTTTLSDNEEASEAWSIAAMTSDDDSDKPIAPSILHHNPTPTTTDDSLFTVPSTYFDRPRQCYDQFTVYDISTQQYLDLQTSYAAHPMAPDTHLFPWLHGIDGHNYHQCLFFGVRKLVVPRYRGLLLLDASSPKRLVQSFDPNDILDPQNNTFHSCSSAPAIHLRNFGIQPWRYASISDIVIFGDNADAVARRVAMAQNQIYNERQAYHERLMATGGKRAVRQANDLSYRIFIITDPIHLVESQFSHLVSQDNTILAPSFLELEKQAMRAMTKATEVTEHFWVGNTGDAPTDDLDDDDDDLDYTVCIECHDLADMPTSSILMLARETLNEGNRGMIHLDMVSTCNTDEGDDELEQTLEDMVGLLYFMDEIISKGQNILIHCADGYTETSVLTLSWLMYKHHLDLPDAYLQLQSQRSFFVMSTELTFLQHLARRLLGTTMTTHSISTTTTTTQSRTLYNDQYLSSRTAIDETIRLPDQHQLHWFNSPRFEGSFPSRILDFLYLGNLNHATNPGMLRALGITHVVSVGENTNLDPKQFRLLYLDNLYDDGIDSIKGRYQEAMAFIDDAQQQQTKCLVHCRVGVSRSAALTICYVMQHCRMTLADAYIFVRAHRLNVIIQPNLKFMYELLQLEQQIYGHIGLPWPVLCHQIHGLNQAYDDDEDESSSSPGSTMAVDGLQ